MWHVYVLQSQKDQTFYIGCSNNYRRRLREHNLGQSLSTKYKCPWKVVYLESHVDSKIAYEREKQIKSYKGGNGFKKLLNL